MAICEKCGSTLSEDVLFCEECGAKVIIVDPEIPPAASPEIAPKQELRKFSLFKTIKINKSTNNAGMITNKVVTVWTIITILLIVAILVSIVTCGNAEASLSEIRDKLQNNYSTLQSEHNSLQNNFIALQTKYDNLMEKSNDINTLQSDYSTLQNENKKLQNERNTLQNNNKTLKNENDILKNKNNTLQTDNNRLLSLLSPIRVDSLLIGNKNGNDNWITQPGVALSASQMRYLTPRIVYTSTINGNVALDIRIINPKSEIRQDSKSSPYGYTDTGSYRIFKTERQTLDLNKVGNQNRSTYSSGVWTVEVWYREMCLKSIKVNIN
ncbi:hypothetical protein AGMMS49944_01020 [Spirochaetia bacterium]|nr:hypothetical protein AGMMS49944_01020 [Spirochaetia bacterium]